MTAAPMTAVAVGTTSGWLAVNTASVLRLRDYATGTSTDSEYTQKWRCPDVGSDDSTPIRIARVEAAVRADCRLDARSLRTLIGPPVAATAITWLLVMISLLAHDLPNRWRCSSVRGEIVTTDGSTFRRPRSSARTDHRGGHRRRAAASTSRHRRRPSRPPAGEEASLPHDRVGPTESPCRGTLRRAPPGRGMPMLRRRRPRQ
jgi:hypothetical protein